MNALHRSWLAISALSAFALPVVGCSDESVAAPEPEVARAEFAVLPENANLQQTLAELRAATARYHDLDAAIADGFVPVTECETRPEGQAGIVYVNVGRIIDGVIDTAQPEGLLYEPNDNGSATLVGVELVMPYPAWTGPQSPTFFGASFQPEDEFGVWGLHIWVWRHNPNGMFAVANPNVSCG